MPKSIINKKIDESMPLFQNMVDGSCKQPISYNEVEKYKSMCLPDIT